MLHYVAALWNERDARARHAAHELLCSFDRVPDLQNDGYAVLIERASLAPPAHGSLTTLSRGRGAILGTLFRNPDTGPPGPVRQLSESDADQIIATAGRDLITHYWGDYVALLTSETRQSKYVVHGPCSPLPCLHMRTGPIDLYFSWPESIAKLQGTRFTIDWQQLARQLIGPLLATQTAIEEIGSIPPGACHEVREDHRRLHWYWDPVLISREHPLASFEEAAKELRRITLWCVSAWAAERRRILHCLSGGLDSSIILGCLSGIGAREKTVCLTYYADGPDSDERRYARRAARSAGCPQVWRPLSGNVKFESALGGARFADCPGLRMREVDRMDAEHARDLGADAIFKGHGGDELFCRHHTTFYVADFLRERGFQPELLTLLLHSAITEGTTVWHILVRALQDSVIRRRWNLAEIFSSDQEGESLLTADALHEAISCHTSDLPLARSTRHCPPGKLWQISLAMVPRRFEGPHSLPEDPPLIAPFLSQPVVEVCLRTPTYLQIRNRGERAVARAAFEGLVPAKILSRYSKGGAEQLAWHTLRRNRAFTRELLLDGLLVKEGIADRGKLEAALSDAPGAAFKPTVPIFDLLGAEIWARQWQCGEPRPAQNLTRSDIRYDRIRGSPNAL